MGKIFAYDGINLCFLKDGTWMRCVIEDGVVRPIGIAENFECTAPKLTLFEAIAQFGKDFNGVSVKKSSKKKPASDDDMPDRFT